MVVKGRREKERVSWGGRKGTEGEKGRTAEFEEDEVKF